MAREIVLTRDFPHPAAVVWEVLTDAEELAGWLMPNDFQPVVGHAFTMTTRPRLGFNGIIQCRVLELVPPRRMQWSWCSGAFDSRLTFELEETSGRTRLTLTQTGFQGARSLLPYLALRMGWERKVLVRMTAAVAARARAPSSPAAV